jgi:hypothetical protein
MVTHARNTKTADLMAKVAKLPGWRLEPRKRGGWKVFPPSGSRPFSVTPGPRSPYRQYRNVLARIRREGVDL